MSEFGELRIDDLHEKNTVLDVSPNNRRSISRKVAKAVRSRASDFDRGFGRVLAGSIPRDVLQTLHRKRHKRRSLQCDLLLGDVLEGYLTGRDCAFRTTELNTITRKNIQLVAERSSKVLDFSLVLGLGGKHQLLVAHKELVF